MNIETSFVDATDSEKVSKRAIRILRNCVFVNALKPERFIIENAELFRFEILSEEVSLLLAGFRIRIDLMRIRIRIRIQHFSNCGSGFRIRIPDPDPGFYDQKLIKKLLLKKKFNFFGSKTTIYLSLGLHKGCPSYRRSLQPSKENIQYLKT
jgi:hypothetical protein